VRQRLVDVRVRDEKDRVWLASIGPSAPKSIDRGEPVVCARRYSSLIESMMTSDLAWRHRRSGHLRLREARGDFVNVQDGEQFEDV
jgi:hypothetical protein